MAIVATEITDMSNSTSWNGLLKDVYLPGLTETVFNNYRFTALIPKLTQGDIDFEGQRVIHAFETQRSAGVGPITEGGSFVKPVPLKGLQGYEQLKYLNAYIEITGPLIATAKSNRGSFLNAVGRHFRTNIIATKNQMERMLMGQGDGVLGTVPTAGANGASTLDVDGTAFYDTQFIEPGMYIEFRNPVYGTPTLKADLDGSSASYTTVATVTKGSKQSGNTSQGSITIQADGAGDGAATWTTASATAGVEANDWVTCKDAYTGTTCKEIHGLNGLVSDGTNNSETTANYRYVWPSGTSSGIDKQSYDWAASYTRNINGAISESELLTDLVMLQAQYQGNPNLLLVSPRVMTDYFTDTAESLRQFNTNQAMDWVGGYKGLGVQVGAKQLMLTSLESIPNGTIYMLNTKDFAFCTASNGYQWVLGDGQNILQQSHTKDCKFASAVNYLQFVCFDPGRQYKGYGVSETG